VGSKAFRGLSTTSEPYEVLLVEPEGIKLFRKREGRKVVYGVYGYEPGGRDVTRALKRCRGKAL